MAENEGKKDDQKAPQSSPQSGATAQTPMEIKSPTMEPEGRGAFRKLFMKLGEKVGTVKVSELSPDYLDKVKDADSYKEVLCRLAVSIMHVLQQNPKLVPEAESKMEFDCPPKQDPVELLHATLTSMKETFSAHLPALEVCLEACTKIAAMRRLLNKRGRRALHFMRTFINVDYVVLNDQRQTLLARRQEMDFAKHEYTNNPIDQKKECYEKAVAKFNEQSDAVYKILDTIPTKKERHRLEMIKILDEMRKYHSDVAAQCFLVCKAKW